MRESSQHPHTAFRETFQAQIACVEQAARGVENQIGEGARHTLRRMRRRRRLITRVQAIGFFVAKE